MMEHVSFRLMNEGDEREICKLFIDAFRSKFQKMSSMSDDELYDFLYDNGFISSVPMEGCWVALQEDKLVGVMSLKWEGQSKEPKKSRVGFLNLCKRYGFFNVIKIGIGMAILEEPIGSGNCYVNFIAVSEKARGLKIGSRLLEKADDIVMKDSRLERMTLVVAKSNRAASLYQRLGYEIDASINSRLTSFFFGIKSWYKMSKQLKDGATGRSLRWRKDWYLGFLGLLGIYNLPQILSVFQGEGHPLLLLNFLWFFWFLSFIPSKR